MNVYHIEYVSYRQGPYRIRIDTAAGRIDTAADRIVPALTSIHLIIRGITQINWIVCLA